MEIEAKFRIPDDPTFQRLLQVTTLAGFTLGDATCLELHDRYLDTADRALLAQGYTCRLRRAGDQHLATVKGLGGATGAIHRRAEHQVSLPAPVPPGDWPPGAARELALRLGGGDPFIVLFEIDQIRHSRPLLAGERVAAELSLDQGRISRGDAPAWTFLELEAELAPHGTEQDLEHLGVALQSEWALAPESRSKFEKGLALFRIGAGDLEGEPGAEGRLTDRERAIVERLAGARDVIARRARLLLAWDGGLPRAEWTERSGLSPRRIRYWLSLFKQRRLGIFPDHDLEDLPLPPRQLDTPATDPAPRPAGRRKEETPRPSEADDAAEEEILDMAELAGDLDLFLDAAEEALAQGASGGQVAWKRVRRRPVKLLKSPGLTPDDSMSEAGRKTLRFHYRRMLYHEPATRKGQDIEALHDMRVATRRMRAAFQVFGDFYECSAAARYQKGLRRTGRALGAVRDLDVFREKVLAYLEGLPAAQQSSLDRFLAVLEAQRGRARDKMLAYLNGPRYRRFVEDFGQFVDTKGMDGLDMAPKGDEPPPHRVRHVAPMVIYERLAAVRAYDEWVSVSEPPLSRLHALRIACKRLRYSLEFFEEVLGPGTRQTIQEVVALQDHLGDLQDAVVASGILRDFLVWGTWGHDTTAKQRLDLGTPVIAPGVASYLAAQQSELQNLVATFPAAWQRLAGRDFSRMVAEAVLVL